MYIGLLVKYRLFMSDFYRNSIFSTDFWKHTQISNLMKILPVGAEFFHADRQTDRQTDKLDEANIRFSQVCESAQIWATSERLVCHHDVFSPTVRVMKATSKLSFFLIFFILYCDQQMHNYFTNYHIPTCFDKNRVVLMERAGVWSFVK